MCRRALGFVLYNSSFRGRVNAENCGLCRCSALQLLIPGQMAAFLSVVEANKIISCT